MGGWRSVVLGLAAAGCNQLYGLDRTDLRPDQPPPDGDKDGVIDADDNCPTVANPDQLDGDSDGFGDACDGCPTLVTPRNHDEDRDHRGDDCDPCPDAPDFGADGDADGVPNACEQDAGITSLLGFESFDTLGDDWLASGAPWISRDDAVAASEPPAPGDGITNPNITVSGTEWYLDLGISAAQPWQSGDHFGVLVRADNGDTIGCEIDCAPDCKVVLTAPGATLPKNPAIAVPITRMRVISRPEQTTPMVLICLFEGGSQVYAAGTKQISGHPVIVGSPNIDITYFAAWRNEP